MVNASLLFNNANTSAPTTDAVANTLVEAVTNGSSGFSLPVNASTVVATSMSFLNCFLFHIYNIQEATLLL